MQTVTTGQDSATLPHPMRNSVRFPLRLTVGVETMDGPVEAVTEDISSTGVLFIMPFAPTVNTRLTWTLRLPAEMIGSMHEVTVACTGRVVWHGLAPQGWRVGVVIDDYRMGESHV